MWADPDVFYRVIGGFTATEILPSWKTFFIIFSQPPNHRPHPPPVLRCAFLGLGLGGEVPGVWAGGDHPLAVAVDELECLDNLRGGRRSVSGQYFSTVRLARARTRWMPQAVLSASPPCRWAKRIRARMVGREYSCSGISWAGWVGQKKSQSVLFSWAFCANIVMYLRRGPSSCSTNWGSVGMRCARLSHLRWYTRNSPVSTS